MWFFPPLSPWGLYFLIKFPEGFFPVLCKIVSNVDTGMRFLCSFQSLAFQILEKNKVVVEAVVPRSQCTPLALGLQTLMPRQVLPKVWMSKWQTNIVGSLATAD